MIKFIELFAGIGGFRLGLEPLGWKCVWANEIDPYACKVYRKNFGDKELYEGDIKDVDPKIIPEFDMLTAGFPCQDISNAGKREGIQEGNRSGLWFEIVRIIRSRSPRWVFLENVAALTNRGLDIVLRDLSESGYNAQWDCIPASAVGAPHRRDRVWIIAHNHSIRYFHGESKEQSAERREHALGDADTSTKKNHDTDNRSKRIQGLFKKPIQRVKEFSWCQDTRGIEDYFNRPDIPYPLFWGKNDELPNWVDRIKCLGNSVVPAVVTHVGRCIQNAIEEESI